MLHWLRIIGFLIAVGIVVVLALRVEHLADDLDHRSSINCKIGTQLRDAIDRAADGEQANGVASAALAPLRAYANKPSPYCPAR